MQKFDTNFTNLLEVEVNKPDLQEFQNDYQEVVDMLKKAKTYEDTRKAILRYFEVDDSLSTQFGLISIHHTIDTRDKKYEEYSDMMDNIIPQLGVISQVADKLILNSPFRKEIEEEFNPLWLKKLELSQKTFSPSIVPLLQKENALTNEYSKILGSALIEYNGQQYSLSQMQKFTTSKSRRERRQSSKLTLEWWRTHDSQIGKLFDNLVKVRTKIAKKLGYENFVQLAYDRLGRTGWGPKDVEEYRQQVIDNIVPISSKIIKAQIDRLGYGENTKYYDYAIFYKSGNPLPKGDKDKLVKQAQKLYKLLNSECSKYFNFMVTHNCFDLDAKPGKVGGGYEAPLPALHTPFIFSNFNGTSGDVDVLTHEFGHSLQTFLGSSITVPALRSPGYEVCEMHSMSMEFLAHPHIDLFFGNKADKYRYYHIASALVFIPYGTMVDHFQHIVYEHPEMTHKQRKEEWKKLEQIYRPSMDFSSSSFLRNGGHWMRQRHIIESPFYYIDYTIAQIVSLEFLIESYEELKTNEKADKTFEKYLKLCRLGGTLDYKDLLSASNIKDPMVKPNQKEVAEKVVEILDTFNPAELDK